MVCLALCTKLGALNHDFVLLQGVFWQNRWVMAILSAHCGYPIQYFQRHGRFIATMMIVIYALLTVLSGLAYARTERHDTRGQWVCSAMGGMKWVAEEDAGSSVPTVWDCPLCVHHAPALPPPAGMLGLPTNLSDERSVWVQSSVVLPRLSTGPPMPACGPPMVF